MGRFSQLSPLTVALVAAIEADATLQGLLAGDMIYNSEAPEGAELPYITLGFSTELDDNVFATPGTLAGQTLDIWTRKTTITGGATAQLGNDSLLAIYSAIRALLHHRPLSIAGFRHCIGTIQLQATMQDPDGKTLHGICQYQVISRESA